MEAFTPFFSDLLDWLGSGNHTKQKCLPCMIHNNEMLNETANTELIRTKPI